MKVIHIRGIQKFEARKMKVYSGRKVIVQGIQIKSNK